LNGKYQKASFPDESPETRQRMPELFDAFERLEHDLRQHLEQLRASRWERVAARLSPLTAAPK